MSLSVIVTSRNKGPWLKRALESVKHQTAPPDQVILVDHASDDETAKFGASDGKGLCYVRIAEPEKGPGFAKNTGASLALGTKILFLDGDDELPPDSIEKLLEFGGDYVSGTMPEIVYGNYLEIGFDNIPITREPSRLCICTMLCPKVIFDMASGFSENVPLAEDLALKLKIEALEKRQRVRILHLPVTTYIYHRTAGSQTRPEGPKSRPDFAPWNRAALEHAKDFIGSL